MTRLHGNTLFSIGDLKFKTAEARSFADLYRLLGYVDQPNLSVRNKLKKLMEDEAIDHSHFEKKQVVKRRTKEELEQAVQKARSHTDLLRVLGLRIAGSNMRCIKEAIRRYDINVDHFLADVASNRKMATSPSRTDIVQRWDDLLSGKVREELSSRTLTALMRHDKRGYRCETCKLTEWQGKPIRLEVDHVDGDRKNQSRENLRYLCPNCHSQTETFGFRNRKT